MGVILSLVFFNKRSLHTSMDVNDVNSLYRKT